MSEDPANAGAPTWTDRMFLGMGLLALATVSVASLMPRGSAGDPGAVDKFAHLLAYATIALPLSLVSTARPLHVVGGVMGWSACLEVIQPVVGRNAGLGDLVANLLGVILGIGIAQGGRAALAMVRKR